MSDICLKERSLFKERRLVCVSLYAAFEAVSVTKKKKYETEEPRAAESTMHEQHICDNTQNRTFHQQLRKLETATTTQQMKEKEKKKKEQINQRDGEMKE